MSFIHGGLPWNTNLAPHETNSTIVTVGGHRPHPQLRINLATAVGTEDWQNSNSSHKNDYKYPYCIASSIRHSLTDDLCFSIDKQSTEQLFRSSLHQLFTSPSLVFSRTPLHLTIGTTFQRICRVFMSVRVVPKRA